MSCHTFYPLGRLMEFQVSWRMHSAISCPCTFVHVVLSDYCSFCLLFFWSSLILQDSFQMRDLKWNPPQSDVLLFLNVPQTTFIFTLLSLSIRGGRSNPYKLKKKKVEKFVLKLYLILTQVKNAARNWSWLRAEWWLRAAGGWEECGDTGILVRR